MMTQPVSVGEMLNQSMNVLTKPSVQTFEQYERRGTTRDALTYVAVGAAVAAVVALLFGLLGGIVAAIVSGIVAFISPILYYFVFSYVLYFMGKQQGGTGTQDEVFYSTALYVAPLQAVVGAVSNIPVIGCLVAPVTLALGIYQIYLGYLASRASMNLDQNKAIISVVVAIVAQFILTFVIGLIVGILGFGAAAATGTFNQ